MARAIRPPYASSEGVRTLFQKMQTIRAPKKIDIAWVENYAIQESQPGAIVGLLHWLGVIDDDGLVDETLWQKLRTKQVETLSGLVKSSYSQLFDTVEVAGSDRAMLSSGFIDAYNAGDPGKPLKAFLALCEIGGISTAAKTRGTPERAAAAKKKKKTGNATKTTRQTPPKLPKPPKVESEHNSIGAGVLIGVQVVIPPEWDKEQIRERVRDVAEAVRQVDGGS